MRDGPPSGAHFCRSGPSTPEFTTPVLSSVHKPPSGSYPVPTCRTSPLYLATQRLTRIIDKACLPVRNSASVQRQAGTTHPLGTDHDTRPAERCFYLPPQWRLLVEDTVGGGTHETWYLGGYRLDSASIVISVTMVPTLLSTSRKAHNSGLTGRLSVIRISPDPRGHPGAILPIQKRANRLYSGWFEDPGGAKEVQLKRSTSTFWI